MWKIHEPKKVALWNKRHFEEKNVECAACLKYSVLIVVEKYIKCNIRRVAVRPCYIYDARFLKVKISHKKLFVPSLQCYRRLSAFISFFLSSFLSFSFFLLSFPPPCYCLLIAEKRTFLSKTSVCRCIMDRAGVLNLKRRSPFQCLHVWKGVYKISGAQPCTKIKYLLWNYSNQLKYFYSFRKTKNTDNTCDMKKPTDVTISILFIYRRISTCFGPTGPSSGDFTQLFT
jgi:hypothetical protein